MKKNLFWVGALLVGMTIATSCSNEEVAEQVQGKKTVVTATIENGSARTSVNSLYKVVWSENDAFTVFSENGSSKGDMTLQGEGGTTTGDFQGSLNSELAEGDIALFPAVGDATTMTYTFKNAYTDTETDAPLYGTYNGSSFTFSPLSAFIRVNASGLEAEKEYVLTIESTGDQALTGEATMNNGVLSAPSGDGKTITVTLTPAEDVPFLTFDAPIPAQTYTGLTITLKAGNDDATTLKTLEDFTAVAGKLYEATTKVSSHTALAEALVKGGNVDIEVPITLEDNLNVTENTIIDLNNQTLNAAGKTITVAAGKNLTIQNAASLARSSSGPSIIGESDIIIASANSTITIGEGVSLTTTGVNSCCIWVPGSSDPSKTANGVTINTAGNLTATEVSPATIFVNGYVTSGTINITGGSVKHEADVAVYIAGKADLNISGGIIEGTTAVYHKSGELNISGGTLKATGEKVEYEYNPSGCNATGDALVIEACDYPGGVPVVSITGGTFISSKARAIGYYQKSESYKLNNENIITGGTFSDPSACYYLGDNANVTVDMKEDYTGAGFKTQGGQTVTMTIAENKTYTVTAPLVGSPGTQNLGFQFLQGSNVKINGGKITSSDAKMLINNYANLTLSGVTLAPEIPNTMNNQAYYVLSNNCGEVNIEGGTIITAPEGDDSQKVYAFDVCKYSSYPSVTVNVKDATINGNVEYTGEGESQKLNITGGSITGDLVVEEQYKSAASTGITISGGTQNGNGWGDYNKQSGDTE